MSSTALLRPLLATRLGPKLRVQPFLSLSRPSSSSFSSSSSSSSSSSGSTKDPSHPYLHYHPLPSSSPSSVLALSFLPHPPRSSTSRTILGLLPPDARGLGDFKENPPFRGVLHAAIKEGLELGLGEGAEFEAAGRPGDGWIHVTDERAIPPAGRIGETEDLIGSVFVQDNKLVPSTYEPLPSYRLITANGPLTLPKGLDEHLIKVLQRIDEEERAT